MSLADNSLVGGLWKHLQKKNKHSLSLFIQLLKSKSDGEVGQAASCTFVSGAAAPPHSSGVAHEKNASTKVSTSPSHV